MTGGHQQQKRTVPAAAPGSLSRSNPTVEKNPGAALQHLSALASEMTPETAVGAMQKKASLGPQAARLNALQRQVPGRNATGMPDGLKSGVEALSGFDMSGVRVHRNSSAPSAVGALAFAQGTQIHLGPGQEKHLPHEAWHVVQQAQGRVRPTTNAAGVDINDSPALEAEADVMGKRAANSGAQGTEHPAQLKPVPGRGVVQRARGDYKTLWDKDPSLAKLLIRQSTVGNYWDRATAFEQSLGAGLFSSTIAHEGADALIDALEALIGSTRQANEVFGSNPDGQQAGAIPSAKVAEARAQGNLREKMYMVYTAIRSGTVALRLAQKEGATLPTRKVGKHGIALDTYALTNRHLKRRDSVSGQKRDVNEDIDPYYDAMDKGELRRKGAELSPRERELVGGGEDPAFFPGSKYYNLDGKKKLPDTSAGGAGKKKTFERYQLERLAPLAAGLSGSTDWYFNLARQLGLDLTALQKLRLAALGQMLVNRDHSYHEIMHEARTQGKLNDYVDELPAGYTTLAPLSQAQITGFAGTAEFPGDAEAAAYKQKDDEKQAPTGLALQHGLPTRTGFIHLAGPASHRFFGLKTKGTHYPAVLRALDDYNTAKTPTARKAELTKIKLNAQQWLTGHSPAPTDPKYRRIAPLKWLVKKTTAMLAGQPGPPIPVWVNATYDDPVEDPAIEAALYDTVDDASATFDPSKDSAAKGIVKQLDDIHATDPKGKSQYAPIKAAGYDEENMAMVRDAFVNAGNNQDSMKAAKEFLALNKYTTVGYDTYNPVLLYADNDNMAAYGMALKTAQSFAAMDPEYRRARQIEDPKQREKAVGERLHQLALGALDRTKKKDLPKARNEAKLAVRALMRMKPYQGGPLWRGGGLSGGLAITSFSKKFETSFAAKSGFDPAVCLIDHKTARDVSFLSTNWSELEVVFPPGTNFVVLKEYDKGKWPAQYSAIGGPQAALKSLVLAAER